MTAKKLSLLTIGLTVLLVSTGYYYLRQDRRKEAAQLRSENAQLRLKISRDYQARLSQPAPTPAKTSGDRGKKGGPPAGLLNEVPKEEVVTLSRLAKPTYRNEGQATPAAALQTLAWACDRGDMATMEKLQVFDAAAREKTMKFFPSLPPEIRAQWATPEAMSAALYISDGMDHPYPGAAVLEHAEFETINPTRVRLHLPGANGDDYEFQLTTEGWKVAVTMEVVDAAIKKWMRPKPPP